MLGPNYCPKQHKVGCGVWGFFFVNVYSFVCQQTQWFQFICLGMGMLLGKMVYDKGTWEWCIIGEDRQLLGLGKRRMFKRKNFVKKTYVLGNEIIKSLAILDDT